MGEAWDEVSLKDARRSLDSEVYAVVEDLVKNKAGACGNRGTSTRSTALALTGERTSSRSPGRPGTPETPPSGSNDPHHVALTGTS